MNASNVSLAFLSQDESVKYSRTHERYRRQQSAWAPFLASGMGLVAVALLVPTHSPKEPTARIFTDGLRIEIDHGSPAYAALEDSLLSDATPLDVVYVAPKAAAFPVSRLSVTASRENSRKIVAIADDIIEQNQLEQYRLNRQAMAGYNQPQIVVSEPQRNEPERKTISLSELKISREDLIRQLLLPIVSATPRPESRNQFSQPQFHQQTPPSSTHTVADSRSTSKLLQPVDHASMTAFADGKPSALLADRDRQLTISGPLQFSGGVALTSADQKVVVYREVDGDAGEVAQVSLHDGSYQIFVDRPNGELIAELRAGSGEVIGRGRFDLLNLPDVSQNQTSIENVGIKIKPVPHGIYGRVLDSDTPTQVRPLAQSVISFDQLPFTNVTDKSGVFHQAEINESSSVIVRAERAGYWGTLAFARTGPENPVDLPLFTDRSIRALTSAANAEMKMSSVIWGRIMRDGKPVAGAHVDLLTTDKPMHPVYFNTLAIPDPSLTATSANGLYAFVSVEPGSHAVEARLERDVTEPSIFPTENRSVTVVDLDLAADRSASINVYDALKTDWPLPAEVASVGRLHGLVIGRTGERRARFTGGAAPLLLDADAGNTYERVRVAFARTAKQLNFPMVQTNWLDSLAGALRFNRDSKAGTIVGFIQGSLGYKVSMDETALSGNSRVVYFDSRGEWTREEFGKPGGGFVVFNVNPGFRTVLLELSNAKRSFATSVLVDPLITNVINQKLQ